MPTNGKILILGAGGQLGRAFIEELTQRGEDFMALDQAQVDLARPEEIRLPLDQVRALINCAAYTNVDGAEEDEATATQVNGHAVRVLAELCGTASVPLVHFSTDYVFDGNGNIPLKTDNARAPLNAYGRSKAMGEEFLEASGAEYLLIRTSWVYAPWGNNFVKTMMRLMAEKDELRVVNDQRGRPTHASCLAARAFALFERGQRGTFHVTDEGECTWYEFADAIREISGSSCRVLPCTTAEFPRRANRPAYGVLDTSKADELLGKAASYRTRLKTLVYELRGDRA